VWRKHTVVEEGQSLPAFAQQLMRLPVKDSLLNHLTATTKRLALLDCDSYEKEITVLIACLRDSELVFPKEALHIRIRAR